VLLAVTGVIASAVVLQVELMSAEEMPDAAQWLTLLGMGTSAAVGSTGTIARTLHKMLAGASAVDLTGWTVQDCRRKWLSYLEQLRPLVEEAEAAQAAYRAQQGSSSEQQDSAVQQPLRRPRRAAAQAAVAVIKQEVADVLGVAPLPVCPLTGPIPDVPAPPQAGVAGALGSNPTASCRSPGSSPLAASTAAAAGVDSAAGAAGAAQPMEGVQRANSSSSTAGLPLGSEHSVGSITCSEQSHGSNVEGVPAALLSKIKDLVMQNFYWLLAIMTRNPLLTYEFISVDLVEGRTPLPPAQHEVWGALIERLEMTMEQMQECAACLQVRCCP
jgi:hypothetical protein